MEQIYKAFLQTSGVCTDTRKITAECMFVALKGESFNGNQFAEKAFDLGAKYVIVDELHFSEEKYPQYEAFIFKTDDALKTLQTLANHHRKTFQIPILAICGSNGKTTTKELTKAVFSKKYRTFATQGNLNNHIGLPLTLLAMPKDIEIAVIEMGANHLGETHELCQIAEPNFGIITNVGLDHLEGFGNIENTAKAYGELYQYLIKNDGDGLVNMQDEMQKALMEEYLDHYSGYNYPKDHEFGVFDESLYQAELLESDFFIKFKAQNGEIIQTQLFGEYNFQNILAALALGKYFKVPDELANQAVAEYVPSNNRSQIIQKSSNTILMDAYNANPSSVALALESFAKIKAQNKVVILGDMFELGEMSDMEHQKIGDLLAQLQFDVVVLFGAAMQNALKDNPKAFYFTDKFSLHNWLQDQKFENTHLLIKGSRGVALETVLQFI